MGTLNYGFADYTKAMQDFGQYGNKEANTDAIKFNGAQETNNSQSTASSQSKKSKTSNEPAKGEAVAKKARKGSKQQNKSHYKSIMTQMDNYHNATRVSLNQTNKHMDDLAINFSEGLSGLRKDIMTQMYNYHNATRVSLDQTNKHLDNVSNIITDKIDDLVIKMGKQNNKLFALGLLASGLSLATGYLIGKSQDKNPTIPPVVPEIQQDTIAKDTTLVVPPVVPEIQQDTTAKDTTLVVPPVVPEIQQDTIAKDTTLVVAPVVPEIQQDTTAKDTTLVVAPVIPEIQQDTTAKDKVFVKKGDNVWNIAKKLLGDSATDAEILKLQNLIIKENGLKFEEDNYTVIIYPDQVLSILSSLDKRDGKQDGVISANYLKDMTGIDSDIDINKLSAYA